jgi:hypothetical protein
MDTFISASVPNNTVIQSKNPRYRGLKPFPKGVSGNKKGKPKGTVQIKDSIRKVLTKERATSIAENIVHGAEQGDDRKRGDLLKLTGDFTDVLPQVTVNNNTLISQDVIELARQFFLADQQKQIVDVTASYANT